MLNEDYAIGDFRKDQLYNLVKFVVDQNYNRHPQNANIAHKSEEIEMLFNEEKSIFHDAYYTVAFNNNDEIVGSIRTMEWRVNGTLPIEKIFNIKILDFVDKEMRPAIWHIGRFALKKGYSNIELFKTMIFNAIEPICQDIHSVAFAECDIKLMRTLKKMGIDTEVIAEPVVYLGSTTVPIRMTGKTLSNYYFQNFIPSQSGLNNFKMVI